MRHDRLVVEECRGAEIVDLATCCWIRHRMPLMKKTDHSICAHPMILRSATPVGSLKDPLVSFPDEP
ncbi:hypothetical protein [Mycobacterium sp.]|jgi:hypothetical protein|uniref:hypothetical protein n=1 Tax=Mycobacterium sp. TaxID=1785 RepID=UPI0028BF482D|nr:hypothetical protein [Mycobacterium sp.]